MSKVNPVRSLIFNLGTPKYYGLTVVKNKLVKVFPLQRKYRFMRVFQDGHFAPAAIKCFVQESKLTITGLNGKSVHPVRHGRLEMVHPDLVGLHLGFDPMIDEELTVLTIWGRRLENVQPGQPPDDEEVFGWGYADPQDEDYEDKEVVFEDTDEDDDDCDDEEDDDCDDEEEDDCDDEEEDDFDDEEVSGARFKFDLERALPFILVKKGSWDEGLLYRGTFVSSESGVASIMGEKPMEGFLIQEGKFGSHILWNPLRKEWIFGGRWVPETWEPQPEETEGTKETKETKGAKGVKEVKGNHRERMLKRLAKIKVIR